MPTLALGGALILAGTALAFTQKPAAKTEPQTTPVNLAWTNARCRGTPRVAPASRPSSRRSARAS